MANCVSLYSCLPHLIPICTISNAEEQQETRRRSSSAPRPEIPASALFVRQPQKSEMHVLLDHMFRYDQPPTEDITLEEFETCAIDRLYVLSEIESCYARNRPFEELKKITKAQCLKHVPLDHNSAITKARDDQRRRDITGHFVLRLAFCRSYVCQSWS